MMKTKISPFHGTYFNMAGKVLFIMLISVISSTCGFPSIASQNVLLEKSIYLHIFLVYNIVLTPTIYVLYVFMIIPHIKM